MAEENFRFTHPDPLINKYFLAADRSDLETVAKCLRKGVSINARDSAGRSIFHVAAANGSIALMTMIIEWPHRNVNIESFHYRLTPLHEATLTAREEIVHILLVAGAKVNIPDGNGVTAVHMAVRLNAITILNKLMDYKANLNVIDIFASTPLSIAVLDTQNYYITWLLLRHGADVNKKRPHAMYLFHEAVLNCFHASGIVFLELLTRYGVRVNYIDETGRNALHYAAITGMPVLIDYLLQLGVKPIVKDQTGRTPLLIAQQHGHLEAVDHIRDFSRR